MRKRIVSLLLVLCMVLSILPVFASAAEVVASGYCGGEGDGTNLTWTLDGEGTLTVNGTGEMGNYSLYNSDGEDHLTVPWETWRDNVKTVIVKDGVTTIGEWAFSHSNNLVSLDIPGSVISIGTGAFSSCDNLTSATIPYGVTSIGGSAFSSCNNLVYIAIPESVTSIKSNAFAYCKNLTTVNIPDSVTDMGIQVFCGCLKLENITLPNGITSIKMGTFGDCVSLTNIIIPQGVTEIGSNAFNHTGLTSVTIPGSVTSIRELAFANCLDLKYVIIPDSVISIDKNAFDNCPSLLDVYYSGSEEDWASISGVGKPSGDQITIHYNSTGPDDNTDSEFLLGRDNLPFTNNYQAFFNTAEAIVWENEKAKENGKGYILSGFAEWLKKDLSVWPSYQISDEAFSRLTNGMSNTVRNRIMEERGALWGGSCHGMALVMAIRYLARERLPLSKIDSSLTDNDSTYDLQAPKDSEATESLINYYHLAQYLPMDYFVRKNQWLEIANDYMQGLEFVISKIRNGALVPVNIAKFEKIDNEWEPAGGEHTVILLEILDENDEYYSAKVCDPNCTEYTTMYIYKQTDLSPWWFKIAYTGSQNVNTENISYNAIYQYYSSLQEMDYRNYFGIDDNAGYMTDYNTAHLITDSNASVSFTCGAVELQYENGVVRYSNNISIPYITANTTIDGENSSEVEFLFDKPSQDETSQLSVSAETGNADITLILDGWSIAVMGENDITIQTNSENQSVVIQSEDAGGISAWLTQNETAENWPWYGIAVDVENATELSLTQTESGIQISSDNLDGATVAGQSEDKTDFLTLDTESDNVLLVNKTTSDSSDNYIAIANEDITITFNANGGTVSVDTMTTGTDGKLESLPTPTRDGYTFDGWYTAVDGGTEVTTDTVFTADTTVYAHWTADSASPSTPVEPDDPTPVEPVKPITPSKPSTTTTTPAEPEIPFTDVSETASYYDAVKYVYDEGLMEGTSATKFAPSSTLTRGMVATILYRMEGEPAAAYAGSFTDVADGVWYTDGVEWAAKAGVVKGYTNGKFGPNDPVTREQLAAMLYRYAEYKGYDVSKLADLADYADGANVSEYAKTNVAWAAANGILESANNKLRPTDTATRAEVAVAVAAFHEKFVK